MDTYGEVPTDGLGILDAPSSRMRAPGRPETELLGEVPNANARRGVELGGLRDGQVLLVDGGLPRII
ncbi:hypothetical protein Bra3105_17345 [Brachybacterium halotolerans subsp. kimchii]|uniref:hypothetical protein n=1 Tax=Brachybacterium halotolerans TaxID=2795215 RepID=UPI001E53A2C5|nr:hypothetical protein [Brachybacterium halotolerans]UEJ82571.1 hypothetical protein Bra3105_17345 [Brachybacterium halotolerans subsp. kimchii]